MSSRPSSPLAARSALCSTLAPCTALVPIRVTAAIATAALLVVAAPRVGGAQGHAGHASHQGTPATDTAGMAAHGRAPHGGQLAMAGAGHVELAVQPGGILAVWLYDAALKPLAPPTGASVMLMRGNQMVTLPLAPDAAAGRLTARYDAATYRAFEAVIQLPGGAAGSAAGSAAGAGPREVTFTVPAPGK